MFASWMILAYFSASAAYIACNSAAVFDSITWVICFSSCERTEASFTATATAATILSTTSCGAPFDTQ
jgi:hypothetical protein